MKTKFRVWNKKDKNDRYLEKEVEHDDLLPCPFCGGSAEINVTGNAWSARCKKCFAKSSYHDLPSVWNSNRCLDTHLIRKAVKAWNKRINKL